MFMRTPCFQLRLQQLQCEISELWKQTQTLTEPWCYAIHRQDTGASSRGQVSLLLLKKKKIQKNSKHVHITSAQIVLFFSAGITGI